MRNLAIALALVLGGCAGPQQLFDCAMFDRYTSDLPVDPINASIHADVDPIEALVDPAAQMKGIEDLAAAVSRSPAMQQWYAQTILSTTATAQFQAQPESGDSKSPINVLLLSGGGQWGAFGAGFLKGVGVGGKTGLPRFVAINGISTGAVQALFVAQAMDRSANADPASALARLENAYKIKDEAELVKRGGALRLLTKASFADITPLRRKLEQEICTGNGEQLRCPVLEFLARSDAPRVLLGTVEGGSGTFKIINLNAIASDMLDSSKERHISPRQARECTAGAVLASSAIPVFYQEVRIGRKTGQGKFDGKVYYDGGTRHSVFESATEKLYSKAFLTYFAQYQTAASDQKIMAAGRDSEQSFAAFLDPDNHPDLYVVRNGPTTVQIANRTNDAVGADQTAQRAYSILVNQTEVQSIASLRLNNPAGRIYLATADGFDSPKFREHAIASGAVNVDPKVCARKEDGTMFDTDFMACLRAFGAVKASMVRAGTKNAWMTIKPVLPAPTLPKDGKTPDQ